MADGNTIYDAPETSFVASFVGENNLFTGTVTDTTDNYAIVDTPSGSIRARNAKRNGEYQLARAIKHLVCATGVIEVCQWATFDNQISAKVKQHEFEGSFWQVFFDVAGAQRTFKLSMVNDGTDVGHEINARCNSGFPLIRRLRRWPASWLMKLDLMRD